MPSLTIDPLEWPRSHPQRWVNNSMIVPAQFPAGQDRDLNRVLKHLGKCLFHSPGKLDVVAASTSASRARWRAAGHTSPMVAELGVIMTLTLPGVGAGADAPRFARCAVTAVGGGTTNVDMSYGVEDLGGDGEVPAHHARALFTIPAVGDQAYEFAFSDNGGGGSSLGTRLVSACVFEIMAQPHTLQGYLPQDAQVLGPIYDSHRALSFALADAAFRQQGGLCINLTTDVDTESVTRTSATPANFLNDAITSLTAQPRLKLDMRGRARRSAAGALVLPKAFASVAGGGVAYAQVYSSAGGFLGEVEVTGASPAWHVGDPFELPDTEDAVGFYVVSDGVNAAEFFTTSLYELDES